MNYPIVLELDRKRVLVVGAGEVAKRKVHGLLEANADVHVVAPEAIDEVVWWAEEGRLQFTRRRFIPGDIDGALLVFAATDDRATNDAVVQLARERGVLASSAAGEERDFAVPATHRVGELGIAVWSGHPTVTTRIRDELVDSLDERWALASVCMRSLRTVVDQRGDSTQRRAFWRTVIEGAPDEFEDVASAVQWVSSCAEKAELDLKDIDFEALWGSR